MKKVLKVIGIILLVGIIGITVAGYFMSQPEPEAMPTPEADQLAEKMLTAMNKPAWDSTVWLKWNFAGQNQYIWNKRDHFARVTMGDDVAFLSTKTQKGKAFSAGAEVTGAGADKIIEAGWANFCNDSWWLNAPMKAFDAGTARSIVTLEDGRKGLKVEYNAGGVTPGDSYVWILDENNRPTSYLMWVKIIPVGGVESTWEQYETISTGAPIARLHKMGIDLVISDVAGGMDYSDVGLTEDIFAGM